MAVRLVSPRLWSAPRSDDETGSRTGPAGPGWRPVGSTLVWPVGPGSPPTGERDAGAWVNPVKWERIAAELEEDQEPGR
jgi:hypothetical protein